MTEKETKKEERFVINDIALDENKEDGGVWEDFQGGLKLKIASMQNKSVLKFIIKLNKQKRKRSFKERSLEQLFTDEEEIDTLCELIARYVLLDWKGLFERDDKGKETDVPYSTEKAKNLLKGYKRLRVQVITIANEQERFELKEKLDKAGN